MCGSGSGGFLGVAFREESGLPVFLHVLRGCVMAKSFWVAVNVNERAWKQAKGKLRSRKLIGRTSDDQNPENLRCDC